MKKISAIFCCLLFVGTCSVSNAHVVNTSEQILVVGDEEDDIFLYATPNPDEDLYTDFQVKIGQEVVKTHGWEVSMREERKPELYVMDLNKDGKKEVVVIITLGTGTWIVQKEAHILQLVDTPIGKAYEEMEIDDPVHTILRDFKITATDKTIQVKGRGHSLKAHNPCGETYFHHRFPLSQSVNWKVEGDTLEARVGLTITNNCVPASFFLKYNQKGEIYVAEQVIVNL